MERLTANAVLTAEIARAKKRASWLRSVDGGMSRRAGELEESWRRAGGELEESWRRAGGELEESWRRAGGELEESWNCRSEQRLAFVYSYSNMAARRAVALYIRVSMSMPRQRRRSA
jgi:hypothetical protein